MGRVERSRRRIRICLGLISLVAASRDARGQDVFEIQVYDAETAAVGESGVETHLNIFPYGSTATSADGALPTARVTRMTFEPHVGICRYCEMGAYFQTAIRPEGRFDYAGVKLRAKFRLPRYARGLIGLALNVEWSSIPRPYEPAQLGFELRPIIDLRWRRLWASLNPILGVDAMGRDAGWPRFEPCAALMVNVVGPLDLGAEWYAGFGKIGRFTGASEQVERVLGIVQASFGRVGLHAGAGYGWGGEGPIVKAIVSVRSSD